MIKLTYFFAITIYSLVYLHPVSSLTCLCNVCDEDVDFCHTSDHAESNCFKNSEKRKHPENGSYYIESTYGCLSGGDHLLAHLQCHTNTLRHHEVRKMVCCNNADYCNEQLPDPTDNEKDPRWNMTTDTSNETRDINNLTISTTQTNFMSINLVLYLLSLLIILLIMKQITAFISYFCHRSSNDSFGSLCSLKPDLEKLSQDQHHHHIVSISSASTHSYSVSDDMCHKSIPPIQTNSEESYIPEDPTSGIGGVMLNQRTMARAVGFAKTHDVGSGRFGRVFHAQYHGDDFAVKAFSTIDQESWKREESILRLLNHENVVRFISSEISPLDSNEIWMFLEYCPLGSLCDYLDHNVVEGHVAAIQILYSIINGLNYIHEDYARASRQYKTSIAHRDIKSKNILMRSDYSCCIADFGHALVKIGEDQLDYGNQRLQVGTIRYMAPEILVQNQTLDYRNFLTFAQADLYQFGLIIWEVSNRTRFDLIEPAGEHILPYGDIVPLNPSIDDMIKIVCADPPIRPTKYEKWERHAYMKFLSTMMDECWRAKPTARMETLGVKLRFKEIIEDIHEKLRQDALQSSNIRSICDRTQSGDITRSSHDKTKSVDFTL